jgi:hypothetical protein
MFGSEHGTFFHRGGTDQIVENSPQSRDLERLPFLNETASNSYCLLLTNLPSFLSASQFDCEQDTGKGRI